MASRKQKGSGGSSGGSSAASAAPYSVGSVTLIEPPLIQRPRESSIPREVIDAMVSQVREGWVTNGAVYGEKKEAQSDAAKFKRQVARVLGVPEKEVATRTWATTDNGEFVFALMQRAGK